jgi:hypothetical protein
MQWVRLDTAFPRNHKVLALVAEKDGPKALLAYICGLSYAGEQGTDGFIPRTALPFLHARMVDARKLVEVGLWIDDVGGWLINGWAEFQPTTDESTARSDKARLAARVRWEKAGNARSNAQPDAQAHAQALPAKQSTNERTDVLTESSVTTEGISSLSDARTRARNEEAS